MPESAPAELLLAVIPVPDSGSDTYVNVEKLTSQKGVPFAFGGSILGQSAAATSATVPEAFHIYSMESAFLRFCTRTVRATQGRDSNVYYYTSTISFQRTEGKSGNVLDYHVSMPHVDGLRPDNISKDKLQEVMNANVNDMVPLMHTPAKNKPFEFRPLDVRHGVQPTEFWQRSFVRSPTFASYNLHLHQAALAQLSDTYTLGAALHANPDKVGKHLRNVTMGATLINSVSFHEPTTKVDDWKIAERVTSWGANGRALVHQRFWDVQSGRLILSGKQEVVIRLRDDKEL
ncbi:thioesterase-like superfamily-domain-containing protein [Xylariaceae sp. FL0255]|nr:thioesterase-like superfamily-domain-containing protein [Xylariaceae sp. FL0255]